MKISSDLDRRARLANRPWSRTLRYPFSGWLTLEDRQLMAAGPLGINVAPSLDYVDVMKEAPAWSPLNASTLATDANGWPLADAQIAVFDKRLNQSFDGPDPNAVQPDVGGLYHLSFQGQATVTPDYFQYFAISNQVYNPTTNTTTADLFFYHNLDPILVIDFRNTVNSHSSTGKGVADVKLIQPGYDPNTTQIFTNNEVNALAPFTTLRYLNVDGANSYNQLFSGTYQTVSTPSFQVAAGSHTITFQGLNTTGDATAFVDNVQLFNDNATSMITPPTVGDSGFETVQVGAGNYNYNPSGSPWSFTGGTGLTANGSAFTSQNPTAPEGQQVAFLQNQGAITQTVGGFMPGTYHLSFATMLRNGFAAQTIQVLVDGKVVGTFNPPVGQLTTVNWSQRKLPTASSQTSGPGAPGEAWEYQIALANATNTDMWINIPGPATSDYVTQLANLIKNGDTVNGVFYPGLKANLKVNFEVSNEVWGGIYSNFIYNINEAQLALYAGDTALANDGNTGSYDIAQRFELQQTMNDSAIFQSVLGADPTFAKIRPMIGSGEGDYGYFQNYLPWFENTYGSPGKYFYGIGAANYSSPSDYSSVDNLINSISASIPQIYSTATKFTTIANYYGLHNIAYEGGVYTTGGNTAAAGQVSLAASRDPRMEALEQQLYTAWYAAGGDISEVFEGPYYTFTPDNQYATAELAQASNPSAAPKYHGLLDLSQASPVAVTAGMSVSATAPTSLPINGDSLVHSFATPTKGQTNFYLLNVAVAGNYALTLQTGSGPSNGQVAVMLGDSTSLGTTNLGALGTYNLGTLTLHAGLNTLALNTLSPFTVATLSLSPAVITLADSGFEDDPQPTGANGYVYDPQGTAWTFTGGAGLTANQTPFTYQNPNAPEGNQVAFLQNQGTITQTFANQVPATYQISFLVAQRAYFGSIQRFQVLVDGKSVGTYSTNSYAYQPFSTTAFTLSAGSHAVVFQGLNSTGDATDFLDAVKITSTLPSSTFADSGFEDDPQLGSYLYNPQGTAWTFAGTSGLTANQTAFTTGNPHTPDGQQVAFLQNLGTISQSLAVPTTGNYQVHFLVAQRGNFGAIQSFQILVDGKSVGTFSTPNTAYQAISSATFALAAGNHSFAFQGLNTGDSTDFLDAVTLVPVTGTAPTVARPTGTSSSAPSPAAPSAVTVSIPGFTAVDPTTTTNQPAAPPRASVPSGPVGKVRRSTLATTPTG